MPSTLVDTGIWLALVDPREAKASIAGEIYDLIRQHEVLMPWPIGFETLRTRLARNRVAMIRLEQELAARPITWIDDRPYRDDALQLAFDSSIRKSRALSMVDCLIRLMLDDTNLRINYLATFNEQDFHDVCQIRNVTLLSDVVARSE